jgi:aarF domain-containing kinase
MAACGLAIQLGLGLTLSGRLSHTRIRHGLTLARHLQLNHTPTSRFFFRRKVFWLVPLAGGLTLYLASPTKSFSSNIFTSPTIIPAPKCPTQPTILSPAEPDKSILARIVSLLRDNIWEPILTATRFVYLFFLFMPVIISSPMLLVGVPEKKYGGDRWGAVWWYNFLVARMETAGPSFIKVRLLPSSSLVTRC